jgi:FkbM family methyltransferase
VTNWRHFARQSGRRAGIEITRYRPLAQRRASLLTQQSITLVLDVGGNRGQYGHELRAHGYRGSIISFEPLEQALSHLRDAAASDVDWDVRDVALGEVREEAQISVASNLASSSLLTMLDTHRIAAPDVTVIAQEPVRVVPLDETEFPHDRATLLKLDVQGYEDRVLRGATRSLEQVELLECELSIIPLYGGQLTLRPMLELLAAAHFELVDLEPGPRAADGSTIYVDALFEKRRRDRHAPATVA